MSREWNPSGSLLYNPAFLLLVPATEDRIRRNAIRNVVLLQSYMYKCTPEAVHFHQALCSETIISHSHGSYTYNTPNLYQNEDLRLVHCPGRRPLREVSPVLLHKRVSILQKNADFHFSFPVAAWPRTTSANASIGEVASLTTKPMTGVASEIPTSPSSTAALYVSHRRPSIKSVLTVCVSVGSMARSRASTLPTSETAVSTALGGPGAAIRGS